MFSITPSLPAANMISPPSDDRLELQGAYVNVFQFSICRKHYKPLMVPLMSLTIIISPFHSSLD